VINNVLIPEAAKNKPELNSAIQFYGYYQRPKTPWFYASPEFIPKLFKDEGTKK
jgi:hypothetical protein